MLLLKKWTFFIIYLHKGCFSGFQCLLLSYLLPSKPISRNPSSRLLTPPSATSGISRTNLSHLENGHVLPSVSLIEIAGVLGVDKIRCAFAVRGLRRCPFLSRLQRAATNCRMCEFRHIPSRSAAPAAPEVMSSSTQGAQVERFKSRVLACRGQCRQQIINIEANATQSARQAMKRRRHALRELGK